jgi:hypothetical protein
MANAPSCVCVLLLLCGFCSGCSNPDTRPLAEVSSAPHNRLSAPTAVRAQLQQPPYDHQMPSIVVNSPASGFSYAYGPAIIYTQGQYHIYFCSTGTSDNDWDHIRHVTSSDLVHWSAPDTLLVPSTYERSTCDPSVVLFDGFYYLFYGGNVTTDQTVVFVARSASPDGPFLKYTQRGTWESNPPDSQIVIAPIHPTTNGNYYGAGTPTVVIRNGLLYMWYSDDTAFPPGNCHTYFTTSSDGTTWAPGTLTNVAAQDCSVDVKYDFTSAHFVMVEIINQFANSSLQLQVSADGINWADPQILVPVGQFPAGANNPGISGDDQGALMNGQALVAYGAPYPGTVETWAQWDLWGSLFKPWDLWGSLSERYATQWTVSSPPSAPGELQKCCRNGARGEIRTPDLLVRSQTLYPTELRAHA